MQRKSVVLPPPDGPMIATTWRRATSRSTPSSTRCAPNDLPTPRMHTMGSLTASFPDVGEARFQLARQAGERIVDQEIDDRAGHVEGHRLVGPSDHLLHREHQVDHADQ